MSDPTQLPDDARPDRYGFSRHSTIRDLQARWPNVCRELFVERYTAWPDAAKLPMSEIWEGVWQGVPTGPCLVMVRAPATQNYGSIAIPQQAQEQRSCGFVASVGPMLFFPEVLDKCAYPPMFDHPLDLVGKCYLFQPYSGIPLKGNMMNREPLYLKIRIEDLHFELNELDLRDGSERLAPVTELPLREGTPYPGKLVLP